MERVSVLCLSLLLCSLSGAELQDVPEPQPCPSNLQAVLQEMSAKLAENSLKIQHLMKHNKGQNKTRANCTVEQLQTWIKKLQTHDQEQNEKLAKNEVRIEELQTLDQEQAAELKEFKNQVDTIKEQNEKLAKNEVRIEELQTLNQAQASELKSLKTRTNVTENQVQSLMTDRAVGQVAFSASLMESGNGTLGPINAHTTLVFKHVVSNIGNAYSPHTGFFTAPVRGAYHFEFHIMAPGGLHATRVVLVKNREHVFSAGEHQPKGWGSGSNGVTLLLEAGDGVFLLLRNKNIISDGENHHSTFSGHLLFPM